VHCGCGVSLLQSSCAVPESCRPWQGVWPAPHSLSEGPLRNGTWKHRCEVQVPKLASGGPTCCALPLEPEAVALLEPRYYSQLLPAGSGKGTMAMVLLVGSLR